MPPSSLTTSLVARRLPLLITLALLLGPPHALMPSPVSAASPLTAGPGSIAFSATTASVSEGASAVVSLRRSDGTAGPVRALVTIAGGTAEPADYRRAGTIDPGFAHGSGEAGELTALAVQPDGRVIVGGSYHLPALPTRLRAERLNLDGTVDPTFYLPNSGGTYPYVMATQPDGKIVMGGNFQSIYGFPRNHIARLNSDGSLDEGFDSGVGPNGDVMALALQPDGKIVIGGGFTHVNGLWRQRITRLNADGTLDDSFNPDSYTNGFVEAIVLQPDGKIIIGGAFTAVNGVARPMLARLNPNGTLDPSFSSGYTGNATIYTLALQPDGKLVIGGAFTHISGVTRHYVARLNADGSVDAGFNPAGGANNIVYKIALQPDGKVLLLGAFTTMNGAARRYIARLNSDGSLDGGFDPGAGANYYLSEMVLQPDGGVVIAGTFTRVNDIPRSGVARLYGDLFAVWAAADDADKTVTIPIIDDALSESDETIILTVTPLDGAGAGTPSSMTLTIIDNEPRAPVLTSTAPPPGRYGSAYSHSFTATGAPTPSFTLSGALPPGLSFSAASGTLAGTPTRAGTYQNITITAANGAQPDAAQTFDLVIKPAPLTIVADSQSKRYGDPIPSLTFTASGMVDGDTPSAALSGALATLADEASPVGTYLITQGSLAADNYALSFTGGQLTVTKAELTVTALDQIRRVGAANPLLSLAFGGFVLGETSAVLDSLPAAATSALPDSGPGLYPITVSGGSDDNYSFRYISGTLTVTDKDIPTISWRLPGPLTYGTPLSATELGAVATHAGGAVAGRFSYDPPLGAVLPAGTGHVLSATFIPEDTATYAAGTVSVQIDVAPAPLLVRAADAAMVAGDVLPALHASYSGFVNGESVAALARPATLTTTASSSSPPGIYPIVAGGARGSNYAITYVAGTLTISPPGPTLTAPQGVQGRPGSAFTFAVAGLQPQEPLTVRVNDWTVLRGVASATGGWQFALTFGQNARAGEYTISVSGEGPQLSSGSSAMMTVIIDPAGPLLQVPATSALPRARALPTIYLPLCRSAGA